MNHVFAACLCALIFLSGAGPSIGAGSSRPTYPPAQISAVDAPTAVGGQLNVQRVAAGRPPLRQSETLNRVAKKHARDMSRRGYFSHTSPNGRQVSHRLKSGGYRYCWAGENIAQGQGDAEAVIRAWMKSPVHKKIMLHRKPTQYGIALAPNRTWVLVVARPGC